MGEPEITIASVDAILRDVTLTYRGIDQWWDAPNRLLGGKKPIECGGDEMAKVRDAALAMVEGGYT